MASLNVSAYRNISLVDALVASGHLRGLCDHGLVEQKGKTPGTYYVPTVRSLLLDTPVVAGTWQKLAKRANVSDLAAAIRVCNLARVRGTANQ